MKHSTNRTANRQTKREGVILLIVMAMLALFASVGLTFVFYAESEANIARTARQGESLYRADVEAELLLDHFLGQMVYDTDNMYSALRGYSLARTLYGADARRETAGMATGLNGVPYNGAGSLDYTHTFSPKMAAVGGVNNRQLINKTRYDLDGFTLMPEWYSVKEDAAAARFVGGANGSVTYPSLNTPYLAAVTASGEVMLPSYKRPWIEIPSGDPKYADFAKYAVFYPHLTYHPAFPQPDEGGHIKNLPFGPGTRKPGGGYSPNDSLWMYTGFPVMTAANGKKYTVLFAPLIMDLDNRINLMVHGNKMGPGGAHTSQTGFGRWEVNPTRVGVDPTELQTFMAATNRLPTGAFTGDNRYWWLTLNRAGNLPTPPSYSPFNFDAMPVAGGGPLALPAAPSYSSFPSYPTGWDNGDAAETATHAAKYNYFGSPRMHASHMDALLNSSGKNSPALTSDLYKLLRNTLLNPGNPNDPAKLRTRNLLTLLSHDFDKPGLVPFVTSNPAFPYKYSAPITGAVKFPVAGAGVTGGPVAFPDPATNPTPGGEFNGSLYAAKGVLNRLNLNRALPDYPAPEIAPDNSSALIVDDKGFDAAQLARTEMAKELYTSLIAVTGAQDPNVVMVDNTTDEYRAARWLAQLAVNIVDYIDNDDYMTPFPWNGTEVVYGTELPRLVINEAYAQYDVDPDALDETNPANPVATQYRLTCWAELYNPFNSTAKGYGFPREGGAARLLNDKEAVYRLVISKPDPNLRDPANLTGTEDDKLLFRANQGGMGGGKTIVTDWPAANNMVMPSDGRFSGMDGSNEGFYLVGPNLRNGIKGKGKGIGGMYMGGRNPNFPTASYESPYMTAELDFAEAGNPPTLKPTFILQRLACPHRSHHPQNNPYITVDYAEDVWANDVRTHSDTGALPKPLPMDQAKAVGRRQPFAGLAALMEDQAPDPAPANEPKNTFFRQNCKENDDKGGLTAAGNTLDIPFQWLTHLDRPLVNPIELLQVSGFRPHELTQQFLRTKGGKEFDHRAPWFNEPSPAWRTTAENSLIYRLLEVVTTPDLMVGTPVGGRVPGKININTIWDIETFRALCDANGLGGYTDADIDAIFNQLKAYRTPGPDGLPGTADDGMPYTKDRPFSPFSIGVSPGGGQYFYPTGVSSTLLRENPTDASKRMFELNGKTHPYQKMELLTKIFNNTTTRSNVFAVWVTAGFFEVTDDTVNPPKIGREIGKDDNRQIRHKFFAIVDRTEIKARISADGQVNGPERRLMLANDIAVPPGVASVDASVTDNGAPGGVLQYTLLSGDKFSVVPGTYVTLSPDLPNEETVIVTAVNGNKFDFKATKSHAKAEEIIFRCWTGPWSRYDVRRDEKVVPYFTVVD